VDFSLTPLNRFQSKHGNAFDLIIHGDPGAALDFYVIPFASVAHMFVEGTRARGKDGRRRWIATIREHHMFHVNNAGSNIDVSQYHGRPELLGSSGPAGMLRAEGEALVEPFDPTDERDARQRILSSLVRRQGQGPFRRELLRAYEGQCAITGWAVVDVLEAAHILPYSGKHTNHVSNGLLLRSDLHALFDLHLIEINPEAYTVMVNPILANTPYGEMHGWKLRLPADAALRPSPERLRLRAETSLRPKLAS
jgi:hypothetical protein